MARKIPLSEIPELVAQLLPGQDEAVLSLGVSSNEIVDWICSEGHEWATSLKSRGRGKTGCPVCAGQKVLAGFNDLGSRNPALATEWHRELNTVTPQEVLAGTNSNYWWQCPEDESHSWEAAPSARARGTGCPFCAGQKVSVTNSLAGKYPDVAEQWHPSKNGQLKPTMVIGGSHQKAWWKCGGGPDHEWQAAIGSRTRGGRSCPFCAGQKASATNNLRNFPEVLAEWHPTKNRETWPDDVVAGSNKVFWWKCGEGPDHEWQAPAIGRTARGDGCPFCRGIRGSVTNSVASLHPELAEEWHPTLNGSASPSDFSENSGKVFWWKCREVPDHIWKSDMYSRARRGDGCPSCAPHGYDPNAEGYLYLLRREQNEQQQFGITNVPQKRLQTHRRAGWEVLDVVGPADGRWIQETEAALMKYFRSLGVLYNAQQNERFVGYTETWDSSEVQFQTLKALLNALRAWEES